MKMSSKMFFIAIALVIASVALAGCQKTVGDALGVFGDSGSTDGQSDVQDIKEDNAEIQPELKVKCYEDSDCGPVLTKEPYCFQGNVLTEKRVAKCMYKGTINSFCIQDNEDELQLCNKEGEDCSDGRCVVISKEPCKDTDGGKNYGRFGIVNDGFLKTYTDICQDRWWLIEAYCSHGTKGYGVQEYRRCDKGCREGACVGS